MNKHLKISFIISFLAFILVGIILRCYPLGCELWDWKEITKTFAFVFIPVFLVSYISQRFFHLDKDKRGELVVEMQDDE
ncbi:hypothetical protein J4481_02745 [Candidatus Pacearchaeota archaeon]|nr:hypothetical protein [Candidatus Pacearchaeota archaeon]